MTKRSLLFFALVMAGCNSTSKVALLSDGGVDVKAGSGGAPTGKGGTVGAGGIVGAGGAGPEAGSKAEDGSDAAAVRRDAGGTGGLPGTGGLGSGGAGGSSPDGRPDLGPVNRPDAKPGLEVGNDSAAAKPEAGGGDGFSNCPYTGHVTYTINQSANPSTTEQQILALAKTAMDKAVGYYNCYTNITKAITVSYNAGTNTADGNINGSIRFGSDKTYVEYTRAMHEISHTVGIGTASNWRSMISTSSGSGTWKGTNATAEVQAIKGDTTSVITADDQHFWPYGLNYASEVKDESELLNHCRMVIALRKDLGMN
jgi:hypothetical protein